MQLAEGEQILWNSKDDEVIITSHRIRKRHKGAIKAGIQSFLITQLDATEVKRVREYKYLRDAVLYLVLLNGGVYALNHYLAKSVLIDKIFGDIQISGNAAIVVLCVSILMAVLSFLAYWKSLRSVLTFSTNWSSISVDIKNLKFDDITNIIDLVEDAKMKLGKG